jgi:hypothetical protein
MGVHVVDLRGQGESRAGHSVLADPTGRRRRQLTRMGRVVAGMLGIWLCGLFLAGVGLLPGRLGSWALLGGSPSSPPRLERLEHPRQPNAIVTQASSLTKDPRGVSTAAGSRGRQWGAPNYGSRRGDRQLPHAPRQGRLGPAERGRIAPGRPGSSRMQANTQAEAGVQARKSTHPGAVEPSSAAGPSHVAGQSRTKRAEAPGQAELAPGWGVATSAMQTSATSSSSQGKSAPPPEHPEARGHEEATLTPP